MHLVAARKLGRPRLPVLAAAVDLSDAEWCRPSATKYGDRLEVVLITGCRALTTHLDHVARHPAANDQDASLIQALVVPGSFAIAWLCRHRYLFLSLHCHESSSSGVALLVLIVDGDTVQPYAPADDLLARLAGRYGCRQLPYS
jgi:hypothetical protein